MPRTFTLQRLMLVITLICILCGLASAYPQVAFDCAIFITLWAPTIVVWIVLIRLSRQPVAVWIASLFGAWTGLLLVPGVGWTARDGWHSFLWYFLAVAIPPAVGALLIGGISLLGDVLTRRQPN